MKLTYLPWNVNCHAWRIENLVGTLKRSTDEFKMRSVLTEEKELTDLKRRKPLSTMQLHNFQPNPVSNTRNLLVLYMKSSIFTSHDNTQNRILRPLTRIIKLTCALNLWIYHLKPPPRWAAPPEINNARALNSFRHCFTVLWTQRKWTAELNSKKSFHVGFQQFQPLVR